CNCGEEQAPIGDALEASPFGGIVGADTGAVFGLVLKAHHVASIVAGLFEQPREHTLGISGIEDAGLGALAEDARDVVAARDPPMGERCGYLCPAFDARKARFD